MDWEYDVKDGWGGFRGMRLKDGDKMIPFTSSSFGDKVVKKTWPDFIRVARAHKIQRGPIFAHVLEMGETGQGVLVVDPTPRIRYTA